MPNWHDRRDTRRVAGPGRGCEQSMLLRRAATLRATALPQTLRAPQRAPTPRKAARPPRGDDSVGAPPLSGEGRRPHFVPTAGRQPHEPLERVLIDDPVRVTVVASRFERPHLAHPGKAVVRALADPVPQDRPEERWVVDCHHAGLRRPPCASDLQRRVSLTVRHVHPAVHIGENEKVQSAVLQPHLHHTMGTVPSTCKVIDGRRQVVVTESTAEAPFQPLRCVAALVLQGSPAGPARRAARQGSGPHSLHT